MMNLVGAIVNASYAVAIMCISIAILDYLNGHR